MASITIKNIPEALHFVYRRRAKAHARSLQAEILHTLARSVAAPDETGQMEVKEVAGMLKPRRKGVTIEQMREGIGQSLRKSWK
ncbi:MAG: FitA-like ribbon-helix-helix domain-containing protein [Verrucomicrobiales bacterium]